MGYKFIRTPYVSEFTGNDGQTITMELDQDLTLPDMLQAFSDFLRGSGYSFDGTIEIVPPELEEKEPFEYTTFNKDTDAPDENEPTGC